MAAHPSDHACLEWAREGRLRFAPDPAAEATQHFQDCPECRARIEAFAALDAAYAPDEALGPAKERNPRRRVILLCALALALAIALVFAL